MEFWGVCFLGSGTDYTWQWSSPGCCDGGLVQISAEALRKRRFTSPCHYFLDWKISLHAKWKWRLWVNFIVRNHCSLLFPLPNKYACGQMYHIFSRDIEMPFSKLIYSEMSMEDEWLFKERLSYQHQNPEGACEVTARIALHNCRKCIYLSVSCYNTLFNFSWEKARWAYDVASLRGCCLHLSLYHQLGLESPFRGNEQSFPKPAILVWFIYDGDRVEELIPHIACASISFKQVPTLTHLKSVDQGR